VAPLDAHRGYLVLGEPEQPGHVLAVWGGGLVLRNAFDLKQGHLWVLGAALVGARLPNFFDPLGKRTDEFEPLGTTL
jgi:hypothetical protein